MHTKIRWSIPLKFNIKIVPEIVNSKVAKSRLAVAGKLGNVHVRFFFACLSHFTSLRNVSLCSVLFKGKAMNVPSALRKYTILVLKSILPC